MLCMYSAHVLPQKFWETVKDFVIHSPTMRILAKNKRASFDYEIEKKRDVWVILEWHEVKALKTQGCDMRDSIVRPDIRHNCLVMYQLTIPLYKKANLAQLHHHDKERPRRLLITKKELTTIVSKTHKTWLSIIPLTIREDKKRRIKITLWIGKRKKNIQKKQHIKEQDQKRQMQREMKNY